MNFSLKFLGRTGRILNSIDELYNLLLDSDDRHELHADVMNELRALRRKLELPGNGTVLIGEVPFHMPVNLNGILKP